MAGKVARPPQVPGATVTVGGVAQVPAQLVNSFRVTAIIEHLALHLQPGREMKSEELFDICLSLARGIDFAVTNNEQPSKVQELPSLLKQVCQRRNEPLLETVIMVLLISVKPACKLGWFPEQETQELLTLASEVGNKFRSPVDVHDASANSETAVSIVFSRYYPRLKMGAILASLEVKPGFGAYVLDFQIPKNHSRHEKIVLFVAQTDNLDTSACIVSPQQVNFLMNGKGVVKRTNVDKDSGPQIPTSVTGMLKYGTNLLQAIGTFNGNYVILVAFVSTMTLPSPPVLIDYVQSDRTSLDPDCDIIEGPSRISLNCPISFSRIKFPVKGSLCKHLQCFDFGNYVEINSKRPYWRCPHCNQNVSYADIRVDQNIVQVLKEVGDSITHVNISADGSWKAIADADQNQGVTPVRHSQGELHGQQDNADSPATPMILDLTEGGDDLMDELLSNLDTVERKPSQASSPGQTANQKNAGSAGSGFRSGVQYPNAVSQSSSMVNRGNIDARSQFAPVVSDYASMQLQQLRTPVHRVPRAVQALPAQNQVPILPRTSTSNVNSVSSNSGPSTSNGFSTGSLQRFSKPHHDFPRNFNHQSRSSPYSLASRQNPVPTTGPQRSSSPVPLRMPSPASHPSARSSSPLSRTSSFQGRQTGVSSSVPHSQGMGRATYTSNPDISRTTAAQPATATTTTTVNSDQNRRPASRMRGSLQGRDLAEIRNLVLQSTQQTPGGTSNSALTGATAPPHLRGLFGQK